MTVIAFDTLKFSRELMDYGVPQKQAEGQARALANVIDEQIATKHDLKVLELKIIWRLGSLVVSSILISTAILGILISIYH